MANCFGSFAGLSVPQSTVSCARATPQGVACVRPCTVTISRAQCWLQRGCQEVLLTDANLCLPLLTVARAGRTVRTSRFCSPTHCSSQPQTQKLGGFCAHVDLHEWWCGGEKKHLVAFFQLPQILAKPSESTACEGPWGLARCRDVWSTGSSHP